MKLLLGSIILLLSINSMATGDLYCASKDGKFVIEGTVGRVTGDPLLEIHTYK